MPTLLVRAQPAPVSVPLDSGHTSGRPGISSCRVLVPTYSHSVGAARIDFSLYTTVQQVNNQQKGRSRCLSLAGRGCFDGNTILNNAWTKPVDCLAFH